MHAHRVLPFLLIAGGLMMVMQHKRLELLGQCEESEQHRPIGPRGAHSAWSKHVPPMFDLWHKRAHEQEAQATASTPAI